MLLIFQWFYLDYVGDYISTLCVMGENAILWLFYRLVSPHQPSPVSCFISLTSFNQTFFTQHHQSSCLVLEPTVRETTTLPPGVQTPAVVALTIIPTPMEVTFMPMTTAARTTTMVQEAPPTRLQVDTLLASRVILPARE